MIIIIITSLYTKAQNGGAILCFGFILGNSYKKSGAMRRFFYEPLVVRFKAIASLIRWITKSFSK